jgi:hypothetical protein
VLHYAAQCSNLQQKQPLFMKEVGRCWRLGILAANTLDIRTAEGTQRQTIFRDDNETQVRTIEGACEQLRFATSGCTTPTPHVSLEGLIFENLPRTWNINTCEQMPPNHTTSAPFVQPYGDCPNYLPKWLVGLFKQLQEAVFVRP